jgi:hypothetical protein
VISEQGSALAYAVTERGETGKRKAYAAPGDVGVRLGSRTTYAALWGLPSMSRLDSRTQTEGPSPYWYRLNTTSCQADTMSTGTWKATNTTSNSPSNESEYRYY